MAGDTATEIAKDVNEAIGNREDGWSKTYTVKLYGQRYSLTASVEMSMLEVPILGDIRLGTEIRLEMLANTDEVLNETNGSGMITPDEIRERVSMAHSAYMNELEEYSPKMY